MKAAKVATAAQWNETIGQIAHIKEEIIDETIHDGHEVVISSPKRTE